MMQHHDTAEHATRYKRFRLVEDESDVVALTPHLLLGQVNDLVANSTCLSCEEKLAFESRLGYQRNVLKSLDKCLVSPATVASSKALQNVLKFHQLMLKIEQRFVSVPKPSVEQQIEWTDKLLPSLRKNAQRAYVSLLLIWETQPFKVKLTVLLLTEGKAVDFELGPNDTFADVVKQQPAMQLVWKNTAIRPTVDTPQSLGMVMECSQNDRIIIWTRPQVPENDTLPASTLAPIECTRETEPLQEQMHLVAPVSPPTTNDTTAAVADKGNESEMSRPQEESGASPPTIDGVKNEPETGGPPSTGQVKVEDTPKVTLSIQNDYSYQLNKRALDQPTCELWARHGTCQKHGACPFDHPEHMTQSLVCRKWKANKCCRGESCWNTHVLACMPWLRNGICKDRANCKYAHIATCESWKLHGTCENRLTCLFSHPEHMEKPESSPTRELCVIPVPRKREACRRWRQFRDCRFGAKCKHMHEL